jgi:sporulation protein YlmC with PRC-barrel domain
MTRALLLSSATAVCIGLASPAFSAEPTTNSNGSSPPAAAHAASGTSSASACASDIRALSETMQKSGHWMGGSEFGYGYPADGYGYGYDYPMMGYTAGASSGYLNARPGYEIRNLITSANILAQNGQQQACEQVLATTRTIYTSYAANFHGREGSMSYGADWRKQQLASARPVTDTTAALRSDQLIDTDVRDAQGDALGTVHDLVIDPKTGKIAYLIMARGGLFGFDEKFVPVPWNNFKVTRNADLLVLDTTKAVVAAAPTATDAQFRAAGQFAEQSQKVDAYWSASMPRKAASN